MLPEAVRKALSDGFGYLGEQEVEMVKTALKAREAELRERLKSIPTLQTIEVAIAHCEGYDNPRIASTKIANELSAIFEEADGG